MRRARLTAAAAAICLGLIAGGLGMFGPTLSDPGTAVAAPEYRFTNTGAPTSAVDIDALDTFANFTLEQNAPGCAAPTILIQYLGQVLIFQTPTQDVYAPHSIAHITWPTACVDAGESIDVDFGYASGDLWQPPTAQFFSVELLPTPFGGPGISMAVDCDVNTAGVQSACSVPLGSASTQVDVVVINNGPATALAAFNWTLVDPDATRLAVALPGPASCPVPRLNCNPDFLDATESPEGLSGAAWDCDPVAVDSDNNSANGIQSLISCVNAVDAPALATSASLRLARVTYVLPTTATAGSVTVRLKYVNVFDPGVNELHSCNPVTTNAGACFDATINLIEPPTTTPTPTGTITPTPCPTDTAPVGDGCATITPTFTSTVQTSTPTPPPSVHKVPEGNAANADPNVPKANLWLCAQPAACAGPGEGSLRVVERAEDVHTGDEDNDTIEDGLGAYEFTVEYDNFVIASVNPCDLVFGPGGAGSSRGPVDELDSSDNPDCQPDPGALNNGSCVMSLILENLVHFGCVTGGQSPGPTGDFDLASLELVPHEDLANDLFPGNNNGVLTVVKDNGCELVDAFGHPATGSVNGGLTPGCGDLAVTVRILEGDLDLDCDVDVTDAQAIAGHYGAFFGGLLYQKWLDLEPELHDLDIDIKDIQKVFGRVGSTCQAPVPAQPPLDPPVPFG